MTPLHLFGAGGHARVCFDVFKRQWPDRLAIWYDRNWDNVKAKGPVANVLSEDAIWEEPEACDCFVGIGNAVYRSALLERLVNGGHRLVTLIDPDATISPYVEIGHGSVIMAGGILQSGAAIGVGVVVNTAATIDHDCLVSDFAHIAPGAHLAGNVSVREGAWIGVGASVREGLSIGRGAVVGAGSAVVADVPAGAVVAGCPARPIDR